MDDLIARTVWLVKDGRQFVAKNYVGTTIARHRYKSTLAFIVRQHILKDGWNYVGVVDVIEPERRLSRGCNRRKAA